MCTSVISSYIQATSSAHRTLHRADQSLLHRPRFRMLKCAEIPIRIRPDISHYETNWCIVKSHFNVRDHSFTHSKIRNRFRYIYPRSCLRSSRSQFAMPFFYLHNYIYVNGIQNLILRIKVNISSEKQRTVC